MSAKLLLSNADITKRKTDMITTRTMNDITLTREQIDMVKVNAATYGVNGQDRIALLFAVDLTQFTDKSIFTNSAAQSAKNIANFVKAYAATL